MSLRAFFVHRVLRVPMLVRQMPLFFVRQDTIAPLDAPMTFVRTKNVCLTLQTIPVVESVPWDTIARGSQRTEQLHHYPVPLEATIQFWRNLHAAYALPGTTVGQQQ